MEGNWNNEVPPRTIDGILLPVSACLCDAKVPEGRYSYMCRVKVFYFCASRHLALALSLPSRAEKEAELGSRECGWSRAACFLSARPARQPDPPTATENVLTTVHATTTTLETTDDMQRSPASEHHPPRTFFFTFLLMISLLLSPLAPTTTPAAAPSNNTKRCAGRRSDLVVASIVQTLWWICAGTRTAAEKIPHPLRWNPMRHAHWNCSSYTAPPPPPP